LSTKVHAAVDGRGRPLAVLVSPTMSADRARRMAENADGAAYADAVSEYAALGRDELREAARAVMAATSGRG